MLVLQTSPLCVQNEGWLEQRPFEQSLEQHSPLVVQAFPDVLQLALSGWHSFAPPSGPAAHEPPQHALFAVQGWWSEAHSVAPHMPPLQTKVQHSFPVPHALPAALQVPTGFEQVLVVGSQLAEQQSVPVAHVAPTSPQAPPLPVTLPSDAPSAPLLEASPAPPSSEADSFTEASVPQATSEAPPAPASASAGTRTMI